MNKFNDEYGFVNYEVVTTKGGRVLVVNYNEMTEGEDIGYFSTMNEHGLGSSNYIRDIQHAERLADTVDGIVWLNEYEKRFLKIGLDELINTVSKI